MSGRTALVVGGTGPTGPLVVAGLLDRGYEVSIFHSGAHEVTFADPVHHIHGDAHFPQTIAEALGGASWDVVVVQYGRLVHLADALEGRVGHIVAIGGANRMLVHSRDPAWGASGRPAVVSDSVFADPGRWFEHDAARNAFGVRMRDAHARLFEVAARGGFGATYLAYPLLYGPRQPACREWSIVRRILDGRRRIVLADDGLKLQSIGYTENVALAPLLALDRPSTSCDKTYFVADRELLTYKRRAELIAAHIGVEIEIISLPFDLATPCHALYGADSGHRAIACQRVRDELAYRESYEIDEALGRTVDWLRSLPADETAELEHQLGDPFDYSREDALLNAWQQVRGDLLDRAPPAAGLAHPYRHPRDVGEAWQRREFR